MLKIVLACRSRFIFFEEALEFFKLGFNLILIADYPSFFVSRFGIPKDRQINLVSWFFLFRFFQIARNFLPIRQKVILDAKLAKIYSATIASTIPKSFDVFYGLSSFSLEAIKLSNEQEKFSVVFHGNLHLKDNLLAIQQEADRWGARLNPDVCPDWIIEREDEEFQLADLLVVPSELVKETLINRSVAPDKILTSHLGVDFEHFYPTEKEDSTFRVLQVGAVTLEKGVLTLIDAFQQADLGDDAVLEFVGGVPDTYLQRLIAQNGLRLDRVKFSKAIDYTDLHKKYGSASVSVQASVADGFGLVVSQAMACGRPVIVTENVGAKELIENGKNGLIVPASDSQSLARALEYMYANGDKRHNMGKSASEVVEKDFSWTKHTEILAEVLHRRVPQKANPENHQR